MSNPVEFGRPDYMMTVKYDSACVEVWDYLNELREA